MGRDAPTPNEFASRSRSPLTLTTLFEVKGKWIGRESDPVPSPHFQRDKISAAFAGFVIRGNRAISPFAGKIIRADEKQRLVVRGAELQRSLLGADSQNSSG